MAIEMQRRMLYTPVFHIDTNLINARGKLDTMNQIEKWADDEVILVNMSSISFEEAQTGGNVARTEKALSHIFTITSERIGTGDQSFQRVQAALFPGGIQSERQRNDVNIICEAAKYAAILITLDGGSRRQPGGILGNRDKIRDLGTVMSDREAVAFIREKIAERDDFNRRVAGEFGSQLPEWTGKD